jgi:hypothetical protein
MVQERHLPPPSRDALSDATAELGVSLPEVAHRPHDDVVARHLRQAGADIIHQPLPGVGRA